ncbi:MAG: FUSC family protein [Sarcina sp.]
MTKSLALKGFVLGIIAFATFIPFGTSNIMVAMASILLIPELAKDDYTTEKWKEMLNVILVCVVLSFFASIFSFNIYLGSIFTFIIAFFIYYFYTYEDRESKSMIFMIYYILILSIPMKHGELGFRMIATVYGAFLAMLLYLLIFKLNFINIANKSVKSSYEFLMDAIDKKIKSKSYEEEMLVALNHLQNAEEKLFKKAEKSNNNKNNLGEKISTIDLLKSIGNIIYRTKDEQVVLDLKYILCKSYKLYENKINLDEFKTSLNTFDKYLEWPDLIEINLSKVALERFFKNYKNLANNINYKTELNKVKFSIKKYSSEFNLNYKFNFSMKSIKFNTAIKGSILTTMAVFIVFYFNIPDGRWILYTITVVYLPFADHSTKKLKQRVFGTTIGFIVFDILLSISQNSIYIGIIILISLYFSIYTIDYGKRAIFITYTGIASQYIINKSEPYYILSLYRIGYVVLGAIITFIVINYIFPIDLKGSIEDLYYRYKILNQRILESITNKESCNMEYRDILAVNRLLWIKGNFINKYAKSELLTDIIKFESFVVGAYKYLSVLQEQSLLLNSTDLIEANINIIKKILKILIK